MTRFASAIVLMTSSLAFSAGASAQEKTMTLDALLERAAERAAVLDEHDAKVRIAAWQRFRAKHAWTPKIQSDTLVAPVPANADPWRFGENLDAIGSFDLGPYVTEQLRVVVPVYTFGRISTAQDLAEIGVDTAELGRAAAARDVEFQVKRAYHSIRLSNAFQEMLDEGSSLIKDKLEEMDEARDFGDADFDTSVYRQLQVFDAEIDSRVADNALLKQIAEAGLRYFTGIPDERSLDVGALSDEEPLPPLLSLREHLRLARLHRPELQQLDHAVRARQLQARLERANFFPNIVVAAELGVGWSTEDIALRSVCRVPSAGAECVDTQDLFARPYENPLDFFSLGIGLGMRWEIDFFQQYGTYQEVLAQNDEVVAQRRRAVGAIELEVQKLWLEANNALDKTAITERRLEAARRWRDQFGLTMQTGGGDMEDAVDPLRAYYEARALHLQSRYDYLVARAQLARGVGLATLDGRVAPAELNQSEDAASESTTRPGEGEHP